MNPPAEQCFICIHVYSPASEKAEQITSKLCACKVYAHRECWAQFATTDSPTRCPYCYTITQDNPMTEACRSPLPLVLESRQRNARNDPQVQCVMVCCLLYFIMVAILGALYG